MVASETMTQNVLLHTGETLKICNRHFGYFIILSRRYEYRVSTLKTKSIPNIFILDF